jgi:hypothetical protein
VNPKLRASLGDHQVAHRAKAHPAPERRPVDAGDDRVGACVDDIEHLGQLHCVLLVRLAVELERSAHPVHVRPGREARTRTGQDDDPKRVGRLASERPEGLRQLMDQRGVERVVDLGSVERDPADDPGRPGTLDEQGFGHRGRILRAGAARAQGWMKDTVASSSLASARIPESMTSIRSGLAPTSRTYSRRG